MTTIQLPPDQDPNFIPIFCANRNCSFHLRADPQWRCVKNGFYTRAADGARFQLYKCLHCGRGFSTRAFCADYWLRRRDLLPKVASRVSNGMALRQAGRDLEVSHPTIARHVARLGRHCLLLHQELTRDLEIREPVAVDGFETFEYSQFFPFHLNVAAGSKSWFLYDFTDSPLRRKGKMTNKQRRRRCELEAELGRPDPKAVEKGMAALVEALCARVPDGGSLSLKSDEHLAYPRALERVEREAVRRVPISHQVTSSKEARTHGNPLFPVNLTDLLLRHCHANHRRETIAFSKRRMGAIARAHVFQIWRNWIKKRRENGGTQTAAMHVGLADRPLQWEEILSLRLFPDHLELEAWRLAYYWGEVWTQALGSRQCRHEPKRAY